MKFLLDEHLTPAVAVIARGRGLDVASVQELDRLGVVDEVQLRLAARDGRVFVTRDRNDYVALTVRFFEAREPHAGVLIVPFSIPNQPPERLAGALERYGDRFPGRGMQPYTVDFLRGPS